MATEYEVSDRQFRVISEEWRDVEALLGDRYNKGKIDPDLLLQVLRQLQGESIQKMLYAREERLGTLAYPKDFRLCSVTEQRKLWRELLPEYEKQTGVTGAYCNIGNGIENKVIIPSPLILGQGDYFAGTAKILELLKQRANFRSILDDKLNVHHLENTARLPHAHAWLEKTQNHDTPNPQFWVLDCQFGLRHINRSARRARAMFCDNRIWEYGLGIYEVAAMLITHPSLLSGNQEICLWCTGQKYENRADDDDKGDCPVFLWLPQRKEICLTYDRESDFERYPIYFAPTAYTW